MKALAAVFIVLQALAALAMLALSVHAPSGLAPAAGVYFAAAAAFTWWAARRNSLALLAAAGVATFALPPALYGLLDFADRVAYERRIAATQVSDVSDEAILSGGKPIGVRLFYSVTVPERGYFAITPSLYPRDEASRSLRLQPLKWRFDGRAGPPELGPFEAGRRHRLEFELYPPVLFITGKGERCLVNAGSPPRTAPLGPLLVDISDTSYGAPWRGGREEPTRGVYDIAAMYRNVQQGLAPCKVPGP